MPASDRRRRKRRGAEYRAPVTRRESREARAEVDAPPQRSPGRRRDHPDRPPAPWGSFPLVEIVILIGLVLLLTGFFMGEVRGTIMILAGMTLVSVAALELTLREHFSGYRSHTAVLAGAVAVFVLGLGFFLAWPVPVQLGGGLAAFLGGFYLFREAFKRRSGGLGFR